MSPTHDFEDAFKRAVTPGSDRLLAGVALAAAGRSQKDGTPHPPDFTAAYGTMQLDPSSSPVSIKTVMWLASCTKLATTIAALQCVEQGQFTLDDATDIDRILPEWKDNKILTGFTEDNQPILQAPKEKMTLRHLLTHTSGLTYDFMHPLLIQWCATKGQTSRAMESPTADCYLHPFTAEPGAMWQYGPSLDLAGLMVARANNCTLEEYMRRNIFDVLGMNDTSFHPRTFNNLVERLMPITSRLPSTGELIDGYAPGTPGPMKHEQLINSPDDFGGTGMFGTTEDYLKLLKSILYDDGKLLKSQSIETMFTPALSESQRATLEFTLSIPMAGNLMTPAEARVGTPDAGKWSHGIGGLIGLHESKAGWQAGTLRWVGAPCLQWWIDRKGGTCGIFATQLLPPGEVQHAHLKKVFEKEIVAHFGKESA